ncbi:hypothetical protein [Actinoplanes philippinensis]|uniref:hypothetical protein n=1 Tax=Actinoplanes philippinensis TaxID=35752 RepID=UPI0033C47EAD
MQQGERAAGPVGQVVAGRVEGVVAVVPAVQLPVLPHPVDVEFGDERFETDGHADAGGRRGRLDAGRRVIGVPPPLLVDGGEALGGVPPGGGGQPEQRMRDAPADPDHRTRR